MFFVRTLKLVIKVCWIYSIFLWWSDIGSLFWSSVLTVQYCSDTRCKRLIFLILDHRMSGHFVKKMPEMFSWNSTIDWVTTYTTNRGRYFTHISLTFTTTPSLLKTCNSLSHSLPVFQKAACKTLPLKLLHFIEVSRVCGVQFE